MVLLALMCAATAAQPVDSKLSYFVGEWTGVYSSPESTLTVTPDGHFVARRFQPASMNRMSAPSALCRVEGQLEVVDGQVTWRSSTQMKSDFEAIDAARRAARGQPADAAVPDTVRAAQRAFDDWCYPIADFVDHLRSRNLAPLEFAPWEGRPQLFFVEKDQFAGLFGPWPHAQVFRRVGAAPRPKRTSTRWMLWVERDEMLGLSGALTVERDRTFTLTWKDDCVERGSFSARSRNGRFTMKSQSSCAGPLVRELELRTGSADFDPTILNTPQLVRSGNATLHFVPVP